MNAISKILVALVMSFSFASCGAQIKNATTESVKIFGNCNMCKSTIEKAGNIKKVAKVDWDKETQMATITYDSKITNQQEILKRIALSGYDNEQFLAPNDAYAALPGCCQYERKTETKVTAAAQKMERKEEHTAQHDTTTVVKQKEIPQLKPVFNQYFMIKDALVKTDGKKTSTNAKELLSAINAVNMSNLSTEEHTVWMKILKDLKLDTERIADTKATSEQRKHFISLSKNMYALIKVSKQDTPTYYQHCPMANDGKGANWLSKENAVKNPYYGSVMLTCGKTVETIK